MADLGTLDAWRRGCGSAGGSLPHSSAAGGVARLGALLDVPHMLLLSSCTLLAACFLSLAKRVVTVPKRVVAGLRGGGCGVSKPADPQGSQGKPPNAQAQAAAEAARYAPSSAEARFGDESCFGTDAELARMRSWHERLGTDAQLDAELRAAEASLAELAAAQEARAAARAAEIAAEAAGGLGYDFDEHSRRGLALVEEQKPWWTKYEPTTHEQLSEDALAALATAAAAVAAEARASDPVHGVYPDGFTFPGGWEDYGGAELEPLLQGDAELGGASPVRLLDARFLVALAKQPHSRLLRRQELPDGAFLDLAALQQLPHDGGGNLRVACVSYPWLQPDHPDPKGATLRLLGRLLEKFVSWDEYGHGKPCTYAVFLDFCCLPQKDASGQRTEAELALFSRALGSLDQLYSHPHAYILKMSQLPGGYPDGFTFPVGTSPNQAAYKDRGWCFCESSMGNLVKDSSSVLDLAFYTDTNDELISLCHECKGGREPPVHPDLFAKLLEAKSFTSKKADLDTVAALYRRAFEKRIGEAKRLSFGALQWGDDQAKVLSEALRAAHACVELSLMDNYIGDKGVAALAASLRDGAAPKLERLDLCIQYDPQGKLAPARARKAAGAVPMGAAAAKNLAEMLEVHPALKHVALWGAEGPGFSEADRALLLEAAQRRNIVVKLDMSS